MRKIKFNLYKITFWRSARGNEIGPQPELETHSCKNKTDAIKTGRNLSKQYGWRLIQIEDDSGKIVHS